MGNRAEVVDTLAKEMGDAGYCSYAACRHYLDQAWQAAVREAVSELVQKFEKCAAVHTHFGLLDRANIYEIEAEALRQKYGVGE